MKQTRLLACLIIILTCTNFMGARSLDEAMANSEKFQAKAAAFKEDLQRQSLDIYPQEAYALAQAFCKGIKAKDWQKVRSYAGEEAMKQLEKDIKNVESNPKEFEKELEAINCEIEELRMLNEKQGQLYKIYFKNFDRVHIEKRAGVLKVIKF